MEIRNDKLEISKDSWVWKLLSNTGVDKWSAPKESCSLVLMVGWRVVLVAVLVLAFIVGWGILLFVEPVPNPSGWLIFTTLITLVESLAGLVVGSIWFFGVKIPEWYKQLQRTCPKVHWTEG